MGNNLYYLVSYEFLGPFFIRGLFPMLSLFYFNYMIYKNSKPPTRLSFQEEVIKRSDSQEKRLSMTLTGISGSFMTCQALNIFLSSYYVAMMYMEDETCRKAGFYKLSLWHGLSIQLSRVTVVISSSFNFLIYCKFDKVIRRQAMLALTCRGYKISR